MGFWLIKVARARLEKEISVYQQALKEEVFLTADNSKLQAESRFLKQRLEQTLELFEITREISKFLEEDKVFAVFNEKIRKYLQIDDCRFLKPQEEGADSPDWIKFPLKIGKNLLGTLAVKGIKDVDIDKFRILAQQFLLGLKRAVLYQHVQEMATLDSLTRVFTRRYWFQRSNEEIERSRKFKYSLSCLMIDVDRFKDLNDTYGHLVGDAILAAVAKVVKDNIRQIDILGKYGGEEFCAILTETGVAEAKFVSERIRQAFQDSRVQAYDETLSVTISIGIAGFPDDSQDLISLIDKADQALYRAKETGRNKVCVYNAL
jgi:diguanylate cyclase (GGDEF)-like protein